MVIAHWCTAESCDEYHVCVPMEAPVSKGP